MFDRWNRRIPIRLRLTLWYILLMGLTFSALALYLTVRFQRSLQDSIDQSLRQTVAKTINSLDVTKFRTTNQLGFENAGSFAINSSGFAMRLVSTEGTVWDTYGATQSLSAWGLPEEGLATQQGVGDEDDQWRVLSQPILDSNQVVIGWIQAAESLGAINEITYDLQEQVFLGIPLILILAGIGGYFLANRALRPIEIITDTAHDISAQDLSRRLAYNGPKDEIGKLAETFDQMIARLQSSFERERRFTGDAAHELRTPLTILKGQLEVTLSRPRSTAEYEKKLRELAAHVNRLIRLGNALLFLSRTDQNQNSLQRVKVDLNELLEVLIEQVQPLAEEKKIKVIANIEQKLFFPGDNDHLIRLFMNLLENALKYTPMGGQVTITNRNEPDHLVISVNNTGSIIPVEHLPHVFERFYRMDSDRSSHSGGSGLGLAIAQEIARLHGGKIDGQSDVSGGVTFSVWLPVSPSVLKGDLPYGHDF